MAYRGFGRIWSAAPRRSRAGRMLALVSVAVGGLLFPGAATADVIEIDRNGTVTLVAGPVSKSAGPDGEPRTVSVPAAPQRSVGMNHGDVMVAIATAADGARLNGDLIEAVAWQESRLRPGAVSPKGASGVMQLMPATAKALGAQPGDVMGNVRAGATYLRQLMGRYDNDLVKALAAYNAGPGAVDRHGGIPPYRETRAYVGAVMERLAARVVPLSESSR